MIAGLTLALALTPTGGQQPPGEFVHPERCGRERAARLQCLGATLAATAQELTPDPLAAATAVLHYRLDIEIRPDAGCLSGSNVMTIRNLTAGLAAFRFRLDERFRLGGVTASGRSLAWRRIDSATVEVAFDPPVAEGTTLDLAVSYDGCPALFAGPTGISFVPHNGSALVWTLSEPWYGYTWWPSKDDNTDKATADLFFTVPTPMTVASNGTLIETVNVSTGKRRYHWATDYPIAPYLICFSAGTYDTFSAAFDYGSGSMPLSFFVFPEDDNPSNRSMWLQTATMLRVFGDRFGPYPFVNEKYGIYEFTFGGGMEHQTMTGQGGSDQFAFNSWLTAHELAHQWWGDMVTCATWHDIWLNEGFATYSEALWDEDKPGSTGEPALLSAMAYRRPGRVDDSVYVYDTSDEERVFSGDFSYLKGAWVLHMLRHVMGDANFFATLAAYRGAFAYSTATTAQFQAVAEGLYGASLSWFFEPWVYDIGAPAYQYSWRQSTAAGRNYVELYIAQAQPSAYPTFTMPVDIRTRTDGQDSVHVVLNRARAEHALFATEGPVDSLEFDPGQWVLTTDVSATGFVEGPPRIVAVEPPPGGRVPAGLVSRIRVVFHKDVIASASHFSLSGAQTGPVELSFSYDRDSATATLTPAATLPVDDYTLNVSDAITDAASGQRLDGEVTNPSDPAALPSGDGQPGGAATLRFAVVRTLRRHLHRTGSAAP